MTELFIPQAAEWINANHRGHWAVKARRTKAWRTAAGYLAARARLGAHDQVHITAHIHKRTRRKYDAHNLQPTLKAIVDGLVDAGLVPDDTNEHVTGPDARMGEARPDQPGVTLTITERKP